MPSEDLSSSEHQSGRKVAITLAGTQSRYVSSAAEVSVFESDELHDDVRADEIHDDVRAMEKDTALSLALSRLADDFGRESMLSLKRFFGSRRLPVISTAVISTGSLKLDLALGIGGLPKVTSEKAIVRNVEKSPYQERMHSKSFSKPISRM